MQNRHISIILEKLLCFQFPLLSNYYVTLYKGQALSRLIRLDFS